MVQPPRGIPCWDTHPPSALGGVKLPGLLSVNGTLEPITVLECVLRASDFQKSCLGMTCLKALGHVGPVRVFLFIQNKEPGW